MFKDFIKTVYPLVIIAVFCGALLAGAWLWLGPKIDAAKTAEEQAALFSVFPDAVEFIPQGAETNYYKVYDDANQVIGFVFKTGNVGYGGEVSALVGISKDSVVKSVYILDASQETPGLGYKCMEEPWQAQFAGLSKEEVPTGKAGFSAAGIDALTGATITSMAVANNIADAFELFEEVYVPMISTNTNEAEEIDE